MAPPLGTSVGLVDAALDQPLTPLLAALRQGWRGGETAHGAREHDETFWGVTTAAVDTGAGAAAEEQFSLLCGGGGGGEGIKERETEAGDEGVPRLEDLQTFRCQGRRGVGFTAAVAVLLHEALRLADLLKGMPFIFFWLWAVRRARRSPVWPTSTSRSPSSVASPRRK